MKIQVTASACTGCRLCRQVCAIEKLAETNPRRSRLRIDAHFPAPGTYEPIVCNECGDCAEACPGEAIVKNNLGVLYVDGERCDLCGLCVDACTPGVMMRWNDGVPEKCDFCGKCTEVCNTGALVRVE
jgi:Fe-S-cluster-containing dehydrogenase component